MERTIIKIDEEKCNGCGLCATACQEGAIEIVDGKARLAHEHYCDGLGNCLPVCPTGAITFEKREAPAFDAAAVQKAAAAPSAAQQTAADTQPPATQHAPAQRLTDTSRPADALHQADAPHQADALRPADALHPADTLRPADVLHPAATTTHAMPQGGCPGTRMRMMAQRPAVPAAPIGTQTADAPSELRQWPCQIKLVPPTAPFFENAHLLVAADCTAYAYAGFHQRFLKGRVALIGCPKLDNADYAEKLTAILQNNAIRSVTVVRMEVPCCAGLADAAIRALQACGKMIPWQVVVLSVDGQILES